MSTKIKNYIFILSLKIAKKWGLKNVNKMLPKFYFVKLFVAILNDKIKIWCHIFVDFFDIFINKKTQRNRIKINENIFTHDKIRFYWHFLTSEENTILTPEIRQLFSTFFASFFGPFLAFFNDEMESFRVVLTPYITKPQLLKIVLIFSKVFFLKKNVKAAYQLIFKFSINYSMIYFFYAYKKHFIFWLFKWKFKGDFWSSFDIFSRKYLFLTPIFESFLESPFVSVFNVKINI